MYSFPTKENRYCKIHAYAGFGAPKVAKGYINLFGKNCISSEIAVFPFKNDHVCDRDTTGAWTASKNLWVIAICLWLKPWSNATTIDFAFLNTVPIMSLDDHQCSIITNKRHWPFVKQLLIWCSIHVRQPPSYWPQLSFLVEHEFPHGDLWGEVVNLEHIWHRLVYPTVPRVILRLK